MRITPGIPVLSALFFIAIAGCTSAGNPSPAPPTPVATSAPPLPAAATPIAAAQPTPDLTLRPLVWFAPLPPMPTGPGRPYTGSEDFMALFDPGAPWEDAASHLQVFKLYGEWVAYHASDAQLRLVVAGIRERGLALAVEAGPLDPPAGCGQGVESFAGTDEGRLIARRILNVGGRIDLIALDEPLFFASIYDGPSACHWDAEHVAAEVGSYIRVMRGIFPDLVVGDTEPLAGASTPSTYTGWLETFRRVNGYDLAFLHMDIDWGRPTWPAEVKTVEGFGRTFAVPVGIIYTGNFQDSSDEAWLSIAGERVLRYEDQTGGRPEHVLFQSWHDKPDHALPESEPYTFTGFIRSYFEDREALGVRREGAGANLAYQKTTRASNVFQGQTGAFAVDGDPGTSWNSGGFPPQWIQIDLGQSYAITEIRLTAAQSPPGPTTHLVYGSGDGTSGGLVLLHTFAGSTADSDVLVFAPEAPLVGIRVIRVETSSSPSWVGWREIDVIAGE